MNFSNANFGSNDQQARSLKLARSLEESLRELIKLRAQVKAAEEALAHKHQQTGRRSDTRS
ncbi:MAG: hypothetical protein BGP05_16640 [Rhizobiales bacterium 62-47]|jgi:hypothetical protein|nr:MAG: hypothetical protein BGP05_16640 [Rhizobiales bacterium 62-47]